MIGKILEPELTSLIESDQLAPLAELFREMPPPDIAAIINEISREHGFIIFGTLPRQSAIDTFEYLPPETQTGLRSVSPLSIERFAHLQEVSLCNLQLGTLPKSIARFVSTHKLSLDGNQLTELPNLSDLRLRELYLDNNRFSTVPEKIGSSLRTLSLGHNKLTVLPTWLRSMHKLEELYLHGNPELGLPDEILGPTWDEVARRGQKPAIASEILRYYLRIQSPIHERPGSRPLLEARIIVIGDGAAGKTSLVRQLLRKEAARQEEPSTRDVVIEEWMVKLGDREKVAQINVWDFGGQRQMHAAHPYFFTTRTLYLVVAEARKDQQDRVEYWLKMVAKYGDKARALVVINKTEGHQMALDRPKLLDRYRNNLPQDSSAAFFATSCTKGKGINELRSALLRELNAMDQIWALWPVEWFHVKETIRQLRQPKSEPPRWLENLSKLLPYHKQQGDFKVETLTFEEWRSICDSCGLYEERDRDSLLESLGQLGQVVCFPRDFRLSQLGVLNPEWVTRGIYPLLVETKLATKGGMLSMEDLSELLPPRRYPKERHGWLVALLKAFELVFEDEHGRLLLPAQLPMDSPPWSQPEKWGGDNVLHLELQYDVLPESVISQFIVRRHGDARRPGEWWRHGIVLKRGRAEALVRAHVTEQEAKIELRLRGPRSDRHDLLSSIRETLRDPRDSKPPELYVVLAKDCVQKYSDLLAHARRTDAIDLIINGRSVARRLAPILDMIEAQSDQEGISKPAVSLQVNIENKPDMRQHQDKSITISQSSVTNTAIGIDQSLEDSLKIVHGAGDGEVKAALLSLHVQVTELLKSGEITDAATVKDDLETFAKEATRERPRRSQLEVTGKGLIEAASTVATMAPAIIDTVQKIIALISK